MPPRHGRQQGLKIFIGGKRQSSSATYMHCKKEVMSMSELHLLASRFSWPLLKVDLVAPARVNNQLHTSCQLGLQHWCP